MMRSGQIYDFDPVPSFVPMGTPRFYTPVTCPDLRDRVAVGGLMGCSLETSLTPSDAFGSRFGARASEGGSHQTLASFGGGCGC